ncbi:hypothetical protein K0M31_013764 [Melipona bicolor]|uniref:Uncharacterized protein n=1 Tax=Melipona bicolor TaxID=60889 RepID=A0AA40KG53_9HYME|nr:hypothetical protein K0M31_013764 [Melipona bicolor]
MLREFVRGVLKKQRGLRSGVFRDVGGMHSPHGDLPIDARRSLENPIFFFLMAVTQEPGRRGGYELLLPPTNVIHPNFRIGVPSPETTE